MSEVLVTVDQKTYHKCCTIPEGVAGISEFVASPVEPGARYPLA